MSRFKLPLRLLLAMAVGGALLLAWIPGVVYHAQDVDVLLYSAAAARANAELALPYSAAWVEKGPIAVGMYQVLFALFGSYNLAAVAGAWWMLALACTGLSWALAREIGARDGAIWAAALFALAIPVVGGTLNTEMPAAAAATASLLLWCRSAQSRPSKAGLAAWAGVLAGIAFCSRQNAGVIWPMLVVGEAAYWWWNDRGEYRTVLLRAAAITAGFWSVPFVFVVIYMAAGDLETFLYCFYGYNRNVYIAATRIDAARLLSSPAVAFKNFLLPIATTSFFGLVGAGIALREVVGRPTQVSGSRATLLVVVISALGLSASLFVGLRFFSHYFALPLPLWAALGGFALDRIRTSLSKSNLPRWPRLGPLALTAALVCAIGFELAARPWRGTIDELWRWSRTGGLTEPGDPIRWPRHDRLVSLVAEYIRNESGPSERLFVWGMRPHVYVYARRVPATRFVTCTFLTGLVPWERSAPQDDTSRWIVPGAWDLLMQDLESEKPFFIVDASQDHLFAEGAYAPVNYPRLDHFLSTRYEKVFEAGGGDRMAVWRRLEAEATLKPNAGSTTPGATAVSSERRVEP